MGGRLVVAMDIRISNHPSNKMPCLQLKLASLPSKAQLAQLGKEVCALLNKPQSALLLDVQHGSVYMGESPGAVCHIYSGALNPVNQPELSKCIGEHLKSFDIEYHNHYIFFHKMNSADIGWNRTLKSL